MSFDKSSNLQIRTWFLALKKITSLKIFLKKEIPLARLKFMETSFLSEQIIGGGIFKTKNN